MPSLNYYTDIVHSKYNSKVENLINKLLSLLKNKYNVLDINYNEIHSFLFSRYAISGARELEENTIKLLKNKDINDIIQDIASQKKIMTYFSIKMTDIDCGIFKEINSIIKTLINKKKVTHIDFKDACIKEIVAELLEIKQLKSYILYDEHDIICTHQLSASTKKYLKQLFSREDVINARGQINALFNEYPIMLNALVEEAERIFAIEPTPMVITPPPSAEYDDETQSEPEDQNPEETTATDPIVPPTTATATATANSNSSSSIFSMSLTESSNSPSTALIGLTGVFFSSGLSSSDLPSLSQNYPNGFNDGDGHSY